MFWSLSKLNRIETGAVTIQPIEVQALLGFYQVTDSDEIARLKEWSAISRERMWWSEHGLNLEFKSFIAHEAEASHIYGYQALFLPGLLQTADYARELISQIVRRDVDDAAVRERVEVRMKRQQSLRKRLDGPNPPSLTLAIDEAVLLRPVGGEQVMRAQLDHLVSMAERPTIKLVIVPMSLGAQPGLAGTFDLLEFPGDNDVDVLFIESLAVELLITEPETTQTFREVIDILLKLGLTGDDAVAEIRKARRSLRR
jgi:hypothetical protein